MFRIWAGWSRTRIERCALHELVYQARTFTSLADIAPVYNCFKVNPCFQKCKQWMVTQLRFRTYFSFLKSRVLLFVVILQLFSLVFFPQRQVIFSLERKLPTKRQLCASLIEVHQNRNICPLQSSVIKSYREHWQTMPSRFEISSELLFVAHFFLLHFCFSITWHWLMATRQAIKCYSFLFCPVIDSRKSSVLIH